MLKFLKSTTLATGFAMFAMFFGAGNVVFPLTMGTFAQSHNIFAVLGFLISGVCIPFAGLITLLLFDGKPQEFFKKIGNLPGFLIAAFIMALIGPLGAMPRCITLSYSTINLFFPGINLYLFAFISVLLIFFFAYRPSKIVDLLGYILTPLLLLCLFVIIIQGFWTGGTPEQNTLSPLSVFWKGWTEGYQTMDLLGAIFYSSVIMLGLKANHHPATLEDRKTLTKVALKASFVGGILLALVYVGFSYVAAYSPLPLSTISQDLLLAKITLHSLGPYGGIVACGAVALACLTTAIALGSVFAEFMHEEVSKHKLTYFQSLLITVVLTLFFSTFEYTGIVAFLAPLLSICYPGLIVLTFSNLADKLWSIKTPAWPIYLTFFISIVFEVSMQLI
jgi:LIVCS family branched-chain amino acid:cation transporter